MNRDPKRLPHENKEQYHSRLAKAKRLSARKIFPIAGIKTLVLTPDRPGRNRHERVQRELLQKLTLNQKNNPLQC